MIQLTWNGTDISAHCNITGCVHREAAGGKSDTLELQLDRASTWYRWGPEEGDEISVYMDGYATGDLFLTAVIPCGDQYRLIASGLKKEAARKTWGCYSDKTFREIFDLCAAECGTEGKIFGMDERLLIPFCLRKNEGAAGFLDRIATMEGFKLKTWNRELRAIYLAWAEEQDPVLSLNITAETGGVTYRRRANMAWTGLVVKSPWAESQARDVGYKGNNTPIITTLPARNAAQAGRWARNLLREHNRKMEELRIETRFNAKLGALNRIDITGETDASGAWIVEEAEHDLIRKSSSALMYRVRDTIR
jgi:hypothetical protein